MEIMIPKECPNKANLPVRLYRAFADFTRAASEPLKSGSPKGWFADLRGLGLGDPELFKGRNWLLACGAGRLFDFDDAGSR